MNPEYPIYIISKGRWESRLTSKTFEELRIPYRIVIEESEYDQYAAVIDPKKILVLPKEFRANPEWARPDENSGLIGGGIPARNWVWEHSVKEGHARHWIVDDNIRHLYRLHKNKKLKVSSGTIMKAAEDFTDRYSNVGQSGFNYHFFAPYSVKKPPYYLNTRIYSFILNNNELDLRWRGKYNEDTDLSLRTLKQGWCTILFNAFLCGKAATHTMKGGNTEEVYKVGDAEKFDNRYEFAKSLKDQHPDVVEITQKWGRWHHHVDYTVFKQQLKLKDGLNIPKGPNDYGMKLYDTEEKNYVKL